MYYEWTEILLTLRLLFSMVMFYTNPVFLVTWHQNCRRFLLILGSNHFVTSTTTQFHHKHVVSPQIDHNRISVLLNSKRSSSYHTRPQLKKIFRGVSQRQSLYYIWLHVKYVCSQLYSVYFCVAFSASSSVHYVCTPQGWDWSMFDCLYLSTFVFVFGANL